MRQQHRLWHRSVLVLFWIAHIFILGIPLLQVFVFEVLRANRGEFQAWSIPNDIALTICVVLEFVEIQAYQKSNLSPKLYLGSNTFKSSYVTYALFRSVGRWRRFRRYQNSFWSLAPGSMVRELVEDLTFYASLGYAIYIFLLQRRKTRSWLARARAEGGEHALDERYEALMPPMILNSAHKPRDDVYFLVKILQWIYARPAWLNRLPSVLRVPVRWMILPFRYVLAWFLIAIWFPTCNRVPGEPQRLLVVSNPDLDEWDYPKPTLDKTDLYTDSPAVNVPRPSLQRTESNVDALSLRTLDEPMPTRRPASRVPRRHHQPSPGRLLGPRYLCFLDESARGFTTKRTDAVDSVPESDYVFISYTRRHFWTQIPQDDSFKPAKDQLAAWETAKERDQQLLYEYAIRAAQDADVPAFWLDFECCLPEDDADDGDDVEDVYRICDIVRACHSLSIVLGPTLDYQMKTRPADSNMTSHDMMQDWGTRLWTVPEALLCPSEHRISIYTLGSDEPEKVAKRNLPSRVWNDAGTLRQLVDHYEASLHLTQLELISIALECLQRRQTEKRNQGDVAYALAGLLRLRPKVTKGDSDFQAFARLSLANDSDMILERLICLYNPAPNSDWHDMYDAWDARLWQIEPSYQIAGISTHNTVIIGDASGTGIDWESLKMVDFTSAGTKRSVQWHIARSATQGVFAPLAVYLVYVYVMMPAVSRHFDNQETRDRIWTALMIPAVIPAVLSLFVPWFLARHFRDEMTSIQARVFGLEGRPKDLGDIERHVFGADKRRLKWNEDTEDTVEPEQVEEDDGKRVFTLIDTLSCTATTYTSIRPPTMLFVGGREQGLLRVLLCSYDIATRAFVKETVVRMESVMSQRLQRLERFRFSVAPTQELFERSRSSTAFSPSVRDSFDSDRMDIPEIVEPIFLDD